MLIEDAKVGMVIFSEVYRYHYKIIGRYLQQKSGLKYVSCRQRQPIKKAFGKITMFTEKELKDNHFKESNRDFT